MPVNLDKPQRWKADIAQSVDMYNQWFMNFAPNAFRDNRVKVTRDVQAALESTENLTNIKPGCLASVARRSAHLTNVHLPAACRGPLDRLGGRAAEHGQAHGEGKKASRVLDRGFT